jgi:hypothetical protein
VQALKDWDYIQTCVKLGVEKDPFILSTRRTVDKLLINGVAKEKWLAMVDARDSMNADIAKLNILAPPLDEDNWVLFGGGSRSAFNSKQARKELLERIGMACLGGMFLIGPMLIMVLHPSRLTSLLTSSMCVLAFGLVLSWFLEKPFEVLSAAAAYAAVLVVFVGTSVGQGG